MYEINTMASSFLLAGLLTEIQCKSKRLRKNTKASPGQSTGDEADADSADSKHVSSTTKASKVQLQLLPLKCRCLLCKNVPPGWVGSHAGQD